MKAFTPFGATGRFPRGKLNETDEGELQLSITVDQGTVIVAFGTPVTWIGLTPQNARDFAQVLLKRADEIAKVN